MFDKRQIAHSFSRAAATYDAAAIIQEKVREEQLDRLDLLTIQPQRILDLGSGTGHASQQLHERYSRAHIIALDIAEGMLQTHRSRLMQTARKLLPSRKKPISTVCADQDHLPLADGSVDMIFSNLALQWSASLDQALQESKRILSKQGLISFTTVGPDTLRELREAWELIGDDQVPVHDFLDMHDIGDALIRAGFAEPVLDVERYTLHYPNLTSLLKEMKQLGATYAGPDRSQQSLSRAKLAELESAYEKFRVGDQLPLTYEVVFVQAWQPAESARPQDGSTVASFPADGIKRRYA